jgi:hypothetical protein
MCANIPHCIADEDVLPHIVCIVCIRTIGNTVDLQQEGNKDVFFKFCVGTGTEEVYENLFF